MASSAADIRSAEWVQRGSVSHPAEGTYFAAYDPHHSVHASTSWRGGAPDAPPMSNSHLHYPVISSGSYRAPLSDNTRSSPSDISFHQQPMYASYPSEARYTTSPLPLRDPSASDSRFAYPSPHHHYSPPSYAQESGASPHIVPSSTSHFSSSTAATGGAHGLEGAFERDLRGTGLQLEPNSSNSTQQQQQQQHGSGSLDFDQLLRSYDYILNNLPPPDRWMDDQTRHEWSPGTLNELMSTAVSGLRTLNPNSSPPLNAANKQQPRLIPTPIPSQEQPQGGGELPMPIIRHKRRRTVQKCLSCQSTSTPEWRKGPLGPRTLCNACGLVYAKILKKRTTADAEKRSVPPQSSANQAPSPTNSSAFNDSNSSHTGSASKRSASGMKKRSSPSSRA